ncbi:3-hydroxyacyl-CoA dehydrogenase [Acinetobacter tandoii]|jgi:NAD(P)-dependent dehydrogenase (short-subunit alcohol dehydrogenase family)|uniref:3-hydroxyacyl-CoA dehydrogenase n=1 Tax=Acinetobacter tandoii TaxID=202954 RepID=A0A5N4W913_9GAMM|nr:MULTISPECIES: 3-hydroxyacyl-CoA dehydrogenase [Acinetobacter]AUX87245.1 3-hydroxyacyl-CoA dehydrogenase [Acinetobacter sp. ACNIH2]ELN4659057.1 3-hydroxyacyl-CoA dehydrogenase [Escherichia coli]KAB1853634.1 3-hydroxyacyl-CoA dehydrogenase [Acinetobacter tandoii]
MKIQNKVFVVTGGASGLGAATVKYLVHAGARVAFVDMNQELGYALKQHLGENAKFYPLDVTNEQTVKSFFLNVEQDFGQLNGLVNCAGIAPSAKILGRDGLHDLAMFQKVLEVNVTGSFNMIRFAAELMAKYELQNDEEDRGVIINTASVAAYDGQIGQAAYSASKGAIVAMTLPLARELARNAIRVMTIAPGIMETPMLKGMPQNVQDALGQMVPFPPRLAKPEEFASLVGHIVENTYLNGEVIRLDGAIRMAPK